jgi:uncharacterized BrkB/YihY/UPF0761 family membrane protein
VTATGTAGSRQGLTHRIKGWIHTGQQRLEASRTTSRGVDAAVVVQDRDRSVAGNLLACAIAYRLFLWLLPFALLLAAVLGFVQASGSQGPEHLGDNLALGRSVVSVVADAAEQAERSRWIVLVLALVAMYSAGGAGAKTFTAVHGLAWGMPVRRPRKSARASAAFTGAALVTLLLVVGAQYLRKEAPGLGLLAALTIVVVYGALWTAISTLLPHGDAPWTRLVPGALFLGLATQLMHLVTTYYLAGKIDSASELYGGLGVAATVLLGLYLVARLIVAAAVINATLWERARAREAQRRDLSARRVASFDARESWRGAGSLAGGEAPSLPSAEHVSERRKDL